VVIGKNGVGYIFQGAAFKVWLVYQNLYFDLKNHPVIIFTAYQNMRDCPERVSGQLCVLQGTLV
jgi:hypothetical protein